MNIAVVMLGAKRGGVEQAAVDHCEALQHAGFSPTAILHPQSAVAEAMRARGMAIRTVAFPAPWNPLAAYRLRILLREFDVAFLHGNRAGLLSRGIFPTTKIYAVAHSRFFDIESHFHAIIALSEVRAKELRATTVLPIHTIPNLVRVPPLTPRPSWRTPPIIGAMGRLSHEKGFDLLLEAFAQLRAQGVVAHLRIGGDGPEATALKRQAERLGIAPHVTWLGWVSDTQTFYTSIDLFCMPSRTESFPLTLMEALARSIPCVATDCGGPTAIVGERAAPILCAADVQALSIKLTSTLSSPETARAIASSLHTYVSERFSLPAVAAQWKTLLAGQ